MPKLKTCKSVRNRIKVTATGKVLAGSPGSRHLASCKSAKRRRNLRGTKVFTSRVALKLKNVLL